MAQYHVACSPISGTIYAGTVNKKQDKWVNKSDVTDAAIDAVRDHMVMLMKQENDYSPDAPCEHGWEWTLKTGGKIMLMIQYKPPKGEDTDGRETDSV